MTHSEFLLRARGGGHLSGEVTLTGQVTTVAGDVVILSRWIPGCCSQDAELTVRVHGIRADIGDWLAVTGTPEGEDLRASSSRTLDAAPPRREG